ncbi:helix-turn-helix domain-containing protein [Flavobacterium mekongense]|uniref:helix-turn-helix domain-containing protein n=1 Tax=Flavobacterium mekongense TaxID=3379707 RepID=UPI00399A0E85
MKTLGSTLKEARELIPYTLRQVEEATGISNAYLSQLENDKIKNPSANTLYKLATVYNLQLNSLLTAAGIIEKTSTTTENSKELNSEWLKRLAFYADSFSESQQNEIIEFIKFIKHKEKNA